MSKDHCLGQHVLEDVSQGCFSMNHSLGIREMPEGYALMLNHDKSHFYGIRWDGVVSNQHWDKWAIYRWAKEDICEKKITA